MRRELLHPKDPRRRQQVTEALFEGVRDEDHTGVQEPLESRRVQSLRAFDQHCLGGWTGVTTPAPDTPQQSQQEATHRPSPEPNRESPSAAPAAVRFGSLSFVSSTIKALKSDMVNP